MKTPLNILHLEDDPNDAALVVSTLAAGGIACRTTCVQNSEEFMAALEAGDIDLVLSDFSLPTFDGLSALKMARHQVPDLPVILVSGTLGEEQAVDSLKSGATDYVLKEGLVRLVPAVRRAMHDVEERTQRRLVEAQFIEAQKMEVVGQLAGGVAHDFNNVLAVIMGYSELIVHDLPPDDPLQKYVEEIRIASERACGLTRQLLVFSRKQTVEAVVLDLNHVVGDMTKMLERLIDEKIEMRFIYGQELGQIRADSGYVWQVLMNLVVNARDAMPEGGKLIVETGCVTVEAGEYTDIAPGDYVTLSVSDTGTGMTGEVKAKMFDPFFTTKTTGKGTGLGLATCKTIVQQCGGFIIVSSDLGLGATFKIYFPQIDSSPVVVRPKAVQPMPLPRGVETLLVVEDEPALRHLSRGGLEALGYKVLTASNGQKGLRVFREHQGPPPISLVVTDVMMPQMGGKVMVEWLKTKHPNLKILFVSGYADDAFAADTVHGPGIAFLPKPYTSARLAGKIRELLDSDQGSDRDTSGSPEMRAALSSHD
jgi:two-component system cell cycle sensor histidine kinase/response regulator CckA